MIRIMVWIYLLARLPLALAASPPTAPAVAGSWRAVDTAFARVSARQQAVLSLPFAARITHLTVEPGGRVSAGEVLAHFDAPMLRQHLAAWVQARAELALAQKRVQVLRQGEEEHTVTRRERVAVEQAVGEARGRVRMAWEVLAADLDVLHEPADAKHLARQVEKQGLQQAARGLGRLRAPFDGVVVERRAALGEQPAAGEPILELEALERVYLDVGIAEQALARWREPLACRRALGRPEPASGRAPL